MSGYESAYSGEYIPESLRVLTKRMENYRRNHLKLQTESQRSCASGGKIVVNLPASGMIDMNSLTMSGVLKRVGTADCAIPICGVAGLIQRVSVSIGGVVVDSINDYNKLFSHLKTWTTKDAHNRQASIGGITQRSATDALEALYEEQGGTDLAGQLQYGPALQANAVPTTANLLDGLAKNTQRYHRKVHLDSTSGTEAPFNYSEWLGFLGRGGYMQMDLLPAPVQVEIVLDSNKAVAGAGGDFEITDLYFKVASVEFPLLSKALYAMVGANRPLPIPFTRWVNFSFANTANAIVSNKFSIATGCLSNILVTSTPQNAVSQQADVEGQNVSQLISQCSGSTGWYCEVDSRRQSQYDIDMAREGYDWTLGQWGVRNDGDYDNLISSIGDHAVVSSATSPFNANVQLAGTFNYYNSSWLLPFSFSFNEYDADSASNISGISTNGLSSSVAINASTGFQTADHLTNIYCETKAVLQVMPNRQIRVDY